MGDSMVTPPNQISEAMYLQQEWLHVGKSTFGGAGASPTDVAAFPAFDDNIGKVKQVHLQRIKHTTTCNDNLLRLFFNGKRTD